MSALTITATNVKKIGGSPSPTQKTVGAVAITAGMVCILVDGLLVKADPSTLDLAKATYIALNSANPGQAILVAVKGDIVNLGTGTAGTFYWLGTAGTFVPYADLTSTKFVTQLGYFRATNEFVFNPIVTGVQL